MFNDLENTLAPVSGKHSNPSPSAAAGPKGTHMADSGPKTSFPSGGGALHGLGEAFSTEQFTGTSSLSLPVPVSPARGFEPSLSLSYSSGSGNSAFGLGVQLGVPSIRRRTSKGTPRYINTYAKPADADGYVYSGLGTLVPKTDAQGNVVTSSKTLNSTTYEVIRYHPRKEGHFAIIKRWRNPVDDSDTFWTVRNPDNSQWIFGKTSNARITNPADNKQIFEWLVEEGVSAHGEHQRYYYEAEDTVNVNTNPGTAEASHTHTANRYLSRIAYGNTTADSDAYLLQASHPSVTWQFEIVFDYGKNNVSLTNGDIYHPNQSWPARQDPFSHYQSGFEIRTHRLCRNILMFHRFSTLATDRPVLVSSVELTHDKSKTLTLLTSIREHGYIYDPANSQQPYSRQSQPPVDLDYRRFKPERGQFKALTGPNSESIAGLNDSHLFQLVDLYNEGIPGALYADGQSVLFRSAKDVTRDSNGRYQMNYGPIERVAKLPNGAFARGTFSNLLDLTGDGHNDWVDGTPGQSGYYSINADKSWSGFVPFEAFPAEFNHSHARFADLTGDGLSDLVMVGPKAVRFYANRREKGFARAEEILETGGINLPDSLIGDGRAILGFADLLGTGKQHLFRITHNAVDVWPNLGYGKFGKKISLTNAPKFDEQSFNPAQIFLADLDGSGTTDLIHIDGDKAHYYLNQSGNSFADKASITLPFTYDRTTQVSFADVFGAGTSSLVLTRPQPSVRHWVYDFTGGHKPYLLTEVANNQGHVNTIEYRPSTHQYLLDKKAGNDWITRLPFPVQTVHRTVSQDEVSNETYTQSYTYHHGYYDSYEREFRGFGRVERQDVETFTKTGLPAADSTFVAPVLSKSWYHTGSDNQPAITRRFADEYYKGDSQAAVMADSRLDENGLTLATNERATLKREAMLGLAGSMLRAETYGLDTVENPALAPHPYSVTSSRYQVRYLQKPLATQGNQSHGIVVVFPQESVTYNYDRIPADPHVTQSVDLAIDKYGVTTQSLSISYPRRKDGGVNRAHEDAAQRILRVIRSDHSVIHVDQHDDSLHLGLPKENKSFEITGLPAPSGNGVFSYETLKGDGNTPGLLAGSSVSENLLSWDRHYYWSETTRTELGLGKATALALPGRTETAVLHKADTVKQLVTDDAVLTAPELDTLMVTDGKHILSDGYWWLPGTRPEYGTASEFYRMNSHKDPFDNVTTYSYDSTSLHMTGTTDALGNTTSSEIDYRVLQPWKTTDINDNVSEGAFDPLGRPVATTFYGTEAGSSVQTGFKPISQFSPQATTIVAALANPNQAVGAAAAATIHDNYAWMGSLKTADLVSAGLPSAYAKTAISALVAQRLLTPDGYLHHKAHTLGKATDLTIAGLTDAQTATVYNTIKAVKRVPAHSGVFAAENYFETGKTSPVRISLSYVDGFGRPLQGKQKMEAGNSFKINAQGNVITDSSGQPVIQHVTNRWLTSGRVVYNNKGQPVRQFEPYYVDTSDFVSTGVLNTFGVSDTVYYDPVGRSVSTLTAKGFTSKSVYHPWYHQAFDLNDTVKDSPFFKANIATPDPSSPYYDAGLSDDEKNVIRNATLAHDTPTTTVVDTLGNVILTIRINDGLVTEASFTSLTALTTQQRKDLVARLKTMKLLDSRGALTTGYTGTLTGLGGVYDSHNAAIKTILDKIRADGDTHVERAEYDIRGRQLRVRDARLASGTYNFETVHGLQVPLKSTGADNGSHWGLHNAVGNMLWRRDSRDIQTRYTYDALHRALQIREGNEIRELITYGETATSAKLYNLRGTAHKVYDQCGLTQTDSITIHGQPLKSQTRYASSYKTEIDWPTTSGARDALLESTPYTSRQTHNALGEVLIQTDPAGNETVHTYAISGRVMTIEHKRLSDSQKTTLLSSVSYDARGQLQQEVQGNATTIDYTYEPTTFRLIAKKATRNKGQNDAKVLQDLHFTFDPQGNVGVVEEKAQAVTFNANQQVKPKSTFRYDALYRLVEATGRHKGSLAGQNLPDRLGIPGTGAPQTLNTYNQTFTYDKGDNLTRVTHTSGSAQSTATEMTLATNSNRAVIDSLTSDPAQVNSFFDASGNLKNIGSKPLIWNYRDQLQKVIIINRSSGKHDAEYYVYNAAGQRTRKVTELYASGETVLQIDEVRYFGDYEIRSSKSGAPGSETLTEKLELCHLRANNHLNVRHLEWKTGRPADITDKQYRYTLDNHLGSATMETDASGDMISYEEYLPYGGTAVQSAKNEAEAKYKHYRYSGKERDSQSGLYYYGFRYYAPWLSRWISPDPSGPADGPNMYLFVSNNPMTLVDPNGLAPIPGQPNTIPVVPPRNVNAPLKIQYAPFATKDMYKFAVGEQEFTNRTNGFRQMNPIQNPPKTYVYLTQNEREAEKFNQIRLKFIAKTDRKIQKLQRKGRPHGALTARRDIALNEVQFQSNIRPNNPPVMADLRPNTQQAATPLTHAQSLANPILHTGQQNSLNYRPSTYPHKDSLYLLGHGAPGDDKLYAGGTLWQAITGSKDISSAKLARHLRAEGVPADFDNFRCEACHSANTKHNRDFSPAELDRTSQVIPATLFQPERRPLGQSLLNALKAEGFTQPTVRAYYGYGDYFTLDTVSTRSAEDTDLRNPPRAALQVRTREARVEFR